MSGRATWIAGGGSLVLVCAAILAAVLRSSAAPQHTRDPPGTRVAGIVGPTIPADPPHPRDPKVTVSVSDREVGAPIASGFLGFSFEFEGVRAYTGSDPAHINPLLIQLIRNLTPGQAPVLRIGGNSTDVSYMVGSGVKPLPYQGYQLTPSWMATTGALAKALGARMIMGLNLAADDPALDAAELREYVAALPENSIEAVEIGNEPNVYNKSPSTTPQAAPRSTPGPGASIIPRSARSSRRSPTRRCHSSSQGQRWRRGRCRGRARG